MDKRLILISHRIVLYREQVKSHYRKLSTEETTKLILDYLLHGLILKYLANKYKIGITTVWRYLHEYFNSLSNKYLMSILKKYKHQLLKIDGTCIESYKHEGAYYCGKHGHYCVNVQALTDMDDNILYISESLPGAVHDLKASKIHRIVELCRLFNIKILADKGYISYELSDVFITSVKKPKNEKLSPINKIFNKIISRLRVSIERVFAKMKVYKITLKLRCHAKNIERRILAIYQLMLLN